jgi:tryptophan-rich sensory protein
VPARTLGPIAERLAMAADQTLRKHEMLARFTDVSASALWRERPEPSVSRLRARRDALWRRIARAQMGIGAAMLAVSIVVFLRIVLTAHLVPRWQEALALLLPFLDW